MLPALVIQTSKLLADLPLHYAVCGGYAIDLFLNRKSRLHYDLDISVWQKDRNTLIRFMQAKGWTLYEACGENLVHRIDDPEDQKLLKRNLFCIYPGNRTFKLQPGKEAGFFSCEMEQKEQTELNYIEFLFDQTNSSDFLYARNPEIKRKLSQAILQRGGVPYLAPELILLYKSSDPGREGYQQDYETVLPLMSEEQQQWLSFALKKAYPQGHVWLNSVPRSSKPLR
ncbi:MAG: hypothetical protein LLG09_04425 [Negativicutes bacterium]|nr:hypothetical protein [Negativicutes bacterium]